MNARCGCWMCNKDRPDPTERGFTGRTGFTLGMTRMFVCSACGNKRCPHATDHREACTNSNEPGQLGSRYGTWPNPNRPLLDFVEGKDPNGNIQ